MKKSANSCRAINFYPAHFTVCSSTGTRVPLESIMIQEHVNILLLHISQMFYEYAGKIKYDFIVSREQ